MLFRERDIVVGVRGESNTPSSRDTLDDMTFWFWGFFAGVCSILLLEVVMVWVGVL